MATLPNPFVFNSAEVAADTADAADLLPPGASAVTYQPEPFSDYARRRSMSIVSPPREEVARPPSDWPRGFDPDQFLDAVDPLPMFLHSKSHRDVMERKPNASLLQALFDLAGPER